jgi:hypothetical protein
VGKRGDFRRLSQKDALYVYFWRVYYITTVVYYRTAQKLTTKKPPLIKNNTYTLYIKRANQLNQTGRYRAWLTAKIRPLGLIGCLITKQTSKQTSKRGLFISKSDHQLCSHRFFKACHAWCHSRGPVKCYIWRHFPNWLPNNFSFGRWHLLIFSTQIRIVSIPKLLLSASGPS